MKLDLSRPDWTFGLLWAACLTGALLAPESLAIELSDSFAYLLLFNITSFFVVYKLIASIYGAKRVVRREIIGDVDAILLRGFVKRTFLVWLGLYLFSIMMSGGLPIIWILIGDSRTYVDFGVPTFSGLLNMVRAFVFSICVLLFFRQDGQGKKLYAWLLIVLLLSSIGEMARGNLLVMLLHGVAIWVFFTPIRLKTALKGFAAIAMMIMAFGLMGDLRNENGNAVFNMVDEESVFQELPSGFLWTYLYFVTPAINVSHAISQGMEPLYAPFFSIQSLLPTIIRDSAFEPGVYPIELKIEAFNATSFYAPLLSDFGIYGAALLVLIIQIIVSYLHIRAARGSIFHLLVFPAFYMSVVLSVFYMYFLSLVTIVYPVMAIAYSSYRRARVRA